MTTPVYVRSTDGSNSDDGTTWALAKLDLAGVLAVDEAGGTIYVSDNHAESTAAAIGLGFAGTLAAPMKILCVDDAAEPPTALATTGTVTTTGANAISFGGNIYVYGLTFNSGSGAVNADVVFSGGGGEFHTFEACAFKLVATGSGSSINVGATANASGTNVIWKNCNVSFAAAGQKIELHLGSFVWEGGSVASGSTAITGGLLTPSSAGEWQTALVSGVDLQYLGTSSYLVAVGGNQNARITFRNCRLPSSWTGGLITGTIQPSDRVSLYNCDSADTNYNLWIEDYCGQIIDDTSIYNDAGASDGTTRLSWKMTASSNAEYPHMALRSDEIIKWNETTGSAITATVEIVHNSQGSGTNGVLNDDEIWLEVLYLGTSGVPLGSWMTDAKGGGTANVFTNVLATATAQTTSSAAWTGDSTGWDTQKLSVTFTPQEKGYIHARVMLAKASAVVYVDPLITVN